MTVFKNYFALKRHENSTRNNVLSLFLFLLFLFLLLLLFLLSGLQRL